MFFFQIPIYFLKKLTFTVIKLGNIQSIICPSPRSKLSCAASRLAYTRYPCDKASSDKLIRTVPSFFPWFLHYSHYSFNNLNLHTNLFCPVRLGKTDRCDIHIYIMNNSVDLSICMCNLLLPTYLENCMHLTFHFPILVVNTCLSNMCKSQAQFQSRYVHN